MPSEIEQVFRWWNKRKPFIWNFWRLRGCSDGGVGETCKPPDPGLSRYLSAAPIGHTGKHTCLFFFLVTTHISNNYLGQKKSSFKILNRLAILVVAVLQKKTSTFSHFHLILFWFKYFHNCYWLKIWLWSWALTFYWFNFDEKCNWFSLLKDKIFTVPHQILFSGFCF